MTSSEYQRACHERREIISLNASRRMRGKPTDPVPPKPKRPMVPIAYDSEGNYKGRLQSADECPEGCTVKMKPALY